MRCSASNKAEVVLAAFEKRRHHGVKSDYEKKETLLGGDPALCTAGMCAGRNTRLERFLLELPIRYVNIAEVRVTPTRTEIIILATRTQNVLGEKGHRIRELTAVVQKWFDFLEGSGELYAEKVVTRGLCVIAQAESLHYKLFLGGGLTVRRGCYGVLRFIMEGGAKGCEVVVSGMLRGQQAKSTKFVDGLMIHSGDPINYYVDTAVCRVLLRQGVLGIKVKIILPWDPSGKIGPKKPLLDHVSIVEPKEEILPTTPISEQKPEQPPMPQPVPTA
nr:small ribosomal subunit protein uS3-like [Anolis sagrei ordinatus]